MCVQPFVLRNGRYSLYTFVFVRTRRLIRISRPAIRVPSSLLFLDSLIACKTSTEDIGRQRLCISILPNHVRCDLLWALLLARDFSRVEQRRIEYNLQVAPSRPESSLLLYHAN
jgi:hypothetical protein